METKLLEFIKEKLGITATIENKINDTKESWKVLDHNGAAMFTIMIMDDSYCCGIIHAGNTGWNYYYLSKLTTEDQQLYALLLMETFGSALRKMVSDCDLNYGLVTWTHTTECWITSVLAAGTINNVPQTWELRNEFFNPNSGNNVYVFHCNISDGVYHNEEEFDDDDEEIYVDDSDDDGDYFY